VDWIGFDGTSLVHDDTFMAHSRMDHHALSLWHARIGASVLLGSFKLAMTLVAVVTVDRLGRRPLLLGGVSGMILALITLGFTTPGAPWSHLIGIDPSSLAQLSVIALLLFVGCYQARIFKRILGHRLI